MRRLPQRTARGTARVLVALMALLGPVVVAVAQTAPPEPALRRAPSPLVGYFIMFVLLVAIIGISIMPSKRSHQD